MYGGKKFWASFGVSLAVMVAAVAFLMSAGVAFALPVAGIGGFSVTSNQIDLTNFKLLPTLGQTSERQLTPQANVQADATIHGMTLTKDFVLPMGTARVTISTDQDVTATGLVMNLTGMQADAAFSNMAIKEFYNVDPSKTLSLTADTAIMKNADIRAHYLFTNSITIPSLSLNVDWVH